MFFDIGANIGKWTLANLNNTEHIVSIEADPHTFHTLSKNCLDTKITCLNFAVCNTAAEEIVFYRAEGGTVSTLNKGWLTDSTSRFNNVLFTQITCKAITIDKLIELYGVPDLIKIDVEGGEYMCISSLSQKVKSLCFEWAAETNSITFLCLEHLVSLGFTSFYIQMEDAYTFRPNLNDYVPIDTAKNILDSKIPKQDWGMIWCH